LLRLLIYGYCTGVRSSRGIERRCVDDVAFRYLAAGQVPDFRSVAKFRRWHLDALAGLLLQSVQLAQQVGMVRLGRVALDGPKLRAAASKHKAMSHDRLVDREAQLESRSLPWRARSRRCSPRPRPSTPPRTPGWGRTAGRRTCRAELARRETRLGKLQARARAWRPRRGRRRVKAEQSERRGAQRRDESPDE